MLKIYYDAGERNGLVRPKELFVAPDHWDRNADAPTVFDKALVDRAWGYRQVLAIEKGEMQYEDGKQPVLGKTSQDHILEYVDRVKELA